jgi:undecaprenyl diphosphate synthase
MSSNRVEPHLDTLKLSPKPPTLIPELLPKHVAIIMDGNGRWAEARRRERIFGHIRGAKIAKNTIEYCSELGIQHLTLYAFSTENWSRPEREVSFLMMLLRRHLRKERKNLVKNNIRFSVIGEIDRLPIAVQQEARATIEETKNNTGMGLTFALSYGGRQEITEATRLIAQAIKFGQLEPSEINEQLVASYLQTQIAQIPDPDLIIRTSGEHRLSNFLLWQAAYSELYITNTLWPDMTNLELSRAFIEYSSRERRFGRTTVQAGDFFDESAQSTTQPTVASC